MFSLQKSTKRQQETPHLYSLSNVKADNPHLPSTFIACPFSFKTLFVLTPTGFCARSGQLHSSSSRKIKSAAAIYRFSWKCSVSSMCSSVTIDPPWLQLLDGLETFNMCTAAPVHPRVAPSLLLNVITLLLPSRRFITSLSLPQLEVEMLLQLFSILKKIIKVQKKLQTEKHEGDSSDSVLPMGLC